MEVAAKLMKPSGVESAKVKFLQEAAIMGQFFHPNLIKLHGVVTMGDPVRTGVMYLLFAVHSFISSSSMKAMIVMELMPHGDLVSYLRRTYDE